jgi:hypothetical protein
MAVTNNDLPPRSVPARESLGQRLARWIDDPFASVIVGIVAPTAAVAIVVGAIAGLGVVH